MEMIYNLIISNIYLYICIIICLVILTSILLILSVNSNKRRKIKNDFVQAEKLEEELCKEDESSVSNKLEEILKKMQEDIEVKPEDVVKKFEEEQEEKAIISYQQLVDSVNSGKIEVIDDEETNIDYVENLQLEVDNEPIMDVKEEITVTPEMVKDAIETITTSSIKYEPKKFKKSDIISPVYGIMDDSKDYSDNILDIMNTRDYNKLTEEIKKQEEFLDALKRFRNNL